MRVALAIVETVVNTLNSSNRRNGRQPPFRPVLNYQFQGNGMLCHLHLADIKMVYALTNIGRDEDRPRPNGSGYLSEKKKYLYTNEINMIYPD